MTPNQITVARAITAQMGAIYCPICSNPPHFTQKLVAVGDSEETLFCPHCEMEVEIIVSNTDEEALPWPRIPFRYVDK